MAKPGVRQIFRLRAAARTSSGGRSAFREGLLPFHAAVLAGLRYVQDGAPGLRRIRAGRGFRFVDSRGRPLEDRARLDRIQRLAIPPAWRDVWICPSPHGHIQATGRDARGRKQYRYHARWREVRDGAKYGKMVEFAQTLPGHPRAHGSRPAGSRAPAEEGARGRGAAARGDADPRRQRGVRAREPLVRPDDAARRATRRSRARGCGSASAARAAATTWSDLGPHAGAHREALPGPAGAGALPVPRRAKDGGARWTLSDVNAYLREVTQSDFTAKDFRTWAGTVLAARALRELPAASDERHANRNVVRAIESVAERLGNTPAICRHCYVHPAVIEAYLDGSLRGALRTRPAAARGLPPDEAGVLALVASRLPASLTPRRFTPEGPVSAP